MNAIKATDRGTCCSRSVMLFADGELEPSRSVEIGAHLKSCEPCRCQLELIRAMRSSLRRSCARRAPIDMEERLRAKLGSIAGIREEAGAGFALEGESGLPGMTDLNVRARSVPRETSSDSVRGRRWAMAGAFAVAACFVVVVVMRSSSDRSLHSTFAGPSGVVNDNLSNFDALIEEMVSQHANPLPPEERNPEELTRLEPYVGVPVKRPALTLLRSPATPSASFDGARLQRMREAKNAAVLQYRFKGHRLTVYVFDSRMIPLSRTRLRSRPIHLGQDVIASGSSASPNTAPVYVGNFRGFSVAAAERSGVGYALASDLDEDNNVQMVASF